MLISDSGIKVLNKLAKQSGMDVWFQLIDENGQQKVHDIQEDIDYELRVGLQIFASGLLPLSSYKLSRNEYRTVIDLFDKAGLSDFVSAK